MIKSKELDQTKAALRKWIELNVAEAQKRRQLSQLVAAYTAAAVRAKLEALTDVQRVEETIAATLESSTSKLDELVRYFDDAVKDLFDKKPRKP